MARRGRWRNAKPNLKPGIKLGLAVKKMVKDAKAGKGFSRQKTKLKTASGQTYRFRPELRTPKPTSAAVIRKYSKIPSAINQPMRLEKGNFLVKVKVDLTVIEPPMMLSSYGRKKAAKETRVIDTKSRIELLVEYNPLRFPSKSAAKKKGKKKGSGGGKIHVQIADGTGKVGLQGESYWRFVDSIRRIHVEKTAPKSYVPVFKLTPKEKPFTATLAEVEPKKTLPGGLLPGGVRL